MLPAQRTLGYAVGWNWAEGLRLHRPQGLALLEEYTIPAGLRLCGRCTTRYAISDRPVPSDCYRATIDTRLPAM